MKAADPSAPPAGWGGATLLSPIPAEYHWWLGCSPTAAGMLVAYWDTNLGKPNLYTYHDGDASYWDTANMDHTDQDDYGRNGVDPSRATHSIVASWEHWGGGNDTWDRNGNGIVDPSDVAQWNCLADFLLTSGGGTSPYDIGPGILDYLEWDDPTTSAPEKYVDNTVLTDFTPTWAEYTAEINSGFPVHVGIPGHSILGFGYWNDPSGVYGVAGTDYVVNMTTWGPANGWTTGVYGLIEFSEVYRLTTVRVGDLVPEPASVIVWSLLGAVGIAFARRRKRKAA
jgi:hypothetical protein